MMAAQEREFFAATAAFHRHFSHSSTAHASALNAFFYNYFLAGTAALLPKAYLRKCSVFLPSYKCRFFMSFSMFRFL
jgi:hypothetical protein